MSNVLKSLEKMFYKILKKIFSVLGKDLSEHTFEEILRFFKFCLVGVSNTAISLGVYYIFVFINKDFYLLGNAVGFVVSVLNSYFWNSKFVFKKTDEVSKTIIKTFLAYGTNLLLGTGLLYLFVDLLNISEIIAPLINLIFTIPLNYLLNKFWVMK